MRQLDRISGVAESFEVDPFDHAAGINVQARDDAYGYSHDFSCLLQSFAKVPAWAGRERSAVNYRRKTARCGRRGCC